MKGILPHFLFPLLNFFGVAVPALLSLLFENIDFQYLEFLSPFLLFTILYSLAYCILAFLRLIRFQILVKEQYSSLENRNLQWAKYFLIGTIGIMAISVATSIFETITGDNGWDIDFLTIVPIIFLVAYLGYHGTLQSRIFLPESLMGKKTEEDLSLTKKARPKNSPYSYDTQEMKELQIALDELMRKDRPFLNEDLTLTSLAQSLKVPDKKLSTLLNQNMETSFYNYINGLRVDWVKRKLALPESNNYTILSIAYDCGFKSKSSFNRIFKNISGLSPSDYRKSIVSAHQ